MALKLSQVLDLAIGVDNASVNLLHLREVLVTVITALDIGQVAVRKCESTRVADNAVLENECHPVGTDHTLAGDEEERGASSSQGLYIMTVVTACGFHLREQSLWDASVICEEE